MNGINRRGQKVVCIADMVITCRSHTGIERKYPGPFPVMEGVYTVVNFIMSGIDMDEPDKGKSPGLELAEVPTVMCCCGCGAKAGWPIFAFRPLDERKTDISTFTEIAGKVTGGDFAVPPNPHPVREREPTS